MRKFYSLFVAVLVAFVGITASAAEISFTLKVNLPNVVSYSINGESTLLTQEETVVTYDDQYGYGVYVSLSMPDGYLFKSVTDAQGMALGYSSSDYASFSATDGLVANIEVYNLDENRTASFTLNVDDPSGVSGSFANSQRVSFTETSNVVKFNPADESVLYLSSTNYQKPLYQVTLDGEPVQDNYGTYTVDLTDGCVVDVKCNYPDKDCNITFAYSEGAEGIVTSVSLNGNPVEDFNGTSLTAKLGDAFSFEFDSSNYKVESITINGDPLAYLYGSYNGTVLDDMSIVITAEKYGDIEFTIDIDDPANVVVYTRDSNYNEVPMTLVAGANTVSMPESNSTFYFYAASGCYITSVIGSDGIDYKERGSITATEGATYTFLTGKIVVDQKAVVYVDQPDGWTYFSFQSTVNRQPITLEAGYNTVDFALSFNPFGISWYGCANDGIYLNGEAVAPMYEGSTSYQVSLANDDVLKLYLAAAPKDCDVTFTVATDAQPTVTRDLVVAVPDFRNGLTVFNGTQFAIAGDDISVSVNEEKIEKNDEGQFVFTVSENTAVDITSATGVSNVAVDASAADNRVFTIQGRLAGSASDLNTLPAGIYVVGGKKVVVK